MGGEITVESEVGVGTTFRVSLPATEPRAAGVAPRPEPLAAPLRARLLVIDDERPIALALQRILGAAYDVEAMTNPDAALARIRGGERFDLILCDLMMPGRSGMDVHAALALEAPEQAHRMVFLTGGTCNAHAAEFLAEPTRIVIEKPFDLDALLASIGAALAAFEQTN
jgi:CheY-like chemotaxis protein